MPKLVLQISPEAKGAYFADYRQVAERELLQVMGELAFTFSQSGPLEFIELEDEGLDLEQLLRLSFVQGVYHKEGDLLRPLEQSASFLLHEDFVFGSKFKGKTNERLTQMLINVGLAALGKTAEQGVKLLDPMCGRGTTLLWAMRYSLNARGIEQDPKALEDIQRNLKKWTKLHRQKHKLSDGAITGLKRKSLGKFIDFSAEELSMRVVTGDSRDADQLFKKEKFDLLVSDLPYGVQHFTTKRTRNPLEVIEQSLPAWQHCLKQKGVIVLSFNSYSPSRNDLIALFEQHGYEALPFAAPHRMSESIVRDVVVFHSSVG